MEEIDRLSAFYENEGEEELRLQESGAHYLEFLTASGLLRRHLPTGARVLDSCAGSGAYAFFLAEEGHRVIAGDIVGYNVEVMAAKQRTNPLLEEVYLGDALDLSRFADRSFDAVLCMGALYHLPEPEERRRAVTESLRILRSGGLFVGTYMNRYAVILNNSRDSLDNLDEIMAFRANGQEGIFYASTPEEMEELMDSCGLERVCHAALDGISNFLHGTAGLLDDTGAERWREYHLATCETPSLLGYSYHNLYIGRLREWGSAPSPA